MIKQEMLMRNGIPDGKMTNLFISTSIHLGNICVPNMKQSKLYMIKR